MNNQYYLNGLLNLYFLMIANLSPNIAATTLNAFWLYFSP